MNIPCTAILSASSCLPSPNALESRAKIFLPFSALKGLGNAIDEQNKTKDNMREYEYFDEENKGEEFYE